jgi:hypothetical protein
LLQRPCPRLASLAGNKFLPGPSKLQHSSSKKSCKIRWNSQLPVLSLTWCTNAHKFICNTEQFLLQTLLTAFCMPQIERPRPATVPLLVSRSHGQKKIVTDATLADMKAMCCHGQACADHVQEKVLVPFVGLLSCHQTTAFVP